MNDPHDLLTVEDVAEMLQVTPLSVRRWISSGKLKAHKIEKEFRIRRHEVDHFITKDDVPPKHPHIRPGLHSLISETLIEIKEEIKTMKQLRDIIEDLDSDYLILYELVKKEKDPSTAIDKLLNYEENKNKEIHREIVERLMKKEVAVFFPLPPHAIHFMEPHLEKDHTFNTEERVPPHVSKIPYNNLTLENLVDTIKKLPNIKAVVFDGKKINGEIMVRANMAALINGIEDKLDTVYIHKIPHFPRDQKFVILNLPTRIDVNFI